MKALASLEKQIKTLRGIHRPKVLQERKLTKTHKSTTAKPPREKNTQSSSERKYVHKKELNAQTNQPLSEGGHHTNFMDIFIKMFTIFKYNDF